MKIRINLKSLSYILIVIKTKKTLLKRDRNNYKYKPNCKNLQNKIRIFIAKLYTNLYKIVYNFTNPRLTKSIENSPRKLIYKLTVTIQRRCDAQVRIKAMITTTKNN